jgi:deoxyribodipyrimidine photo-lyase
MSSDSNIKPQSTRGIPKDELKRIFGSRIEFIPGRPPRECSHVLLWVQQSVRISDNHALAAAVLTANTMELPLYAYFCLVPAYPGANARHFAFLLQGLIDLEQSLEKLGIPLIVDIASPKEGIPKAVKGAACLVCDTGYTAVQRLWRRNLGERLSLPRIQLESDIVVPSHQASDKAEYSAATLRPKLQRLMDLYLAPVSRQPHIRHHRRRSDPLPFSPIRSVPPAAVLSNMAEFGIKDTAGPLTGLYGGEREARKCLDRFLSRNLRHFHDSRNDPGLNMQSELSPYLHFGHLSPVTAALAVMSASRDESELKEGAAAFLEQLIVRRELAINFCLHNPSYNSPEAVPDWAQKNLDEHRGDKRPELYSREQLIAAETGDPYWNAAQKELLATGKMHGYMRMYWGKRLIEWIPDWREAYKLLLELNDTYSIDGRDCNGYAGIAWIFGRHDRPFPERPLFGKIRPMGARGLKRKFEMDLYLERISRFS